MVQAVWFATSATPAAAGRLLVVAHHLVVDGVSWRILVPDLAAACAQVAVGRAADPARHRHVDAPVGARPHRGGAGAPRTAEARPVAADARQPPTRCSGRGPLDRGPTSPRPSQTSRSELPAEVTEALLTTRARRRSTAASTTDCSTALALALVRWRRARGDRAVRRAGQSRGARSRGAGGAGRRPRPHRRLVHHDLPGAPGPARRRPRRRVRRRARRRGRGQGGQGAAARRSPTTASATGCCGTSTPRRRRARGRCRAPQISFNYLGRLAAADVRRPRRRPGCRSPTRASHDAAQLRTCRRRPSSTSTPITGHRRRPAAAAPRGRSPPGCSPPPRSANSRELWVSALDRAGRRTPRPGAGGLTPSDLDLVDLDQDAIDDLERRYPALTDVWPLSPLQPAAVPRRAGRRLGRRLPGAADPRPRRRRRPAPTAPGRPGACWTGTRTCGRRSSTTPRARPCRWSRTGSTVPWPRSTSRHWTDGRGDRRDRRDSLAADRATRFDMAARRCCGSLLVATAPEADYRLVLTNHHILLDGWSMPLLIRELLDAVRDRRRPGAAAPGPRLPRLPGVADAARHRAVRARRGRHALAGVDGADPAGPRRTGPAAVHRVARSSASTCDEEQTDRLRDVGARARAHPQHRRAGGLGHRARHAHRPRRRRVRRHRLRPAAADLRHRDRWSDCSSTPCRCGSRCDPEETLGALLDRVQAEQAALLDHHYLGLADIQRAAGPALGFDTLTVFESYPVDRAGLSDGHRHRRACASTGVDGTRRRPLPAEPRRVRRRAACT